MYYEYWGLKKAPFDNVPDPSMYVESHTAVENAVAETLFAIEEGNECIAVIVGDVGSGKTLSLRLILDSLEHEKYRIAFITNPDMTFVQLLQEIIGQITSKECEAASKVELMEIFNKLLFKTVDEGRKVLIFIDEANALAPPVLESLRLLTNMQDDSSNLFTMVLAGQMELAKRLEHPRRANLYQRIGTYNRITKIESVEKLKDYVKTRLELAGAKQMVFTDGAIEQLWEYSEHGTPRLVNKICKLCLKAGETNEFPRIEDEVVKLIGERFAKRISPWKAKAEPSKSRAKAAASVQPLPERERPARRKAEEEGAEEAEVESNVSHIHGGPAEQRNRPEPKEESWETDIGSVHIRISIPLEVLQQAGTSSTEKKMKMAGSLAAQTLQNYPQLAYSSSHDPVALWGDITQSILSVLEQHSIAAGA
ncbi:MAG TPA: AAA family ATPase [Syntrophorhabdales bacterium]|nr:AAA family ATPase [Syntrophorhabdales bacterium]